MANQQSPNYFLWSFLSCVPKIKPQLNPIYQHLGLLNPQNLHFFQPQNLQGLTTIGVDQTQITSIVEASQVYTGEIHRFFSENKTNPNLSPVDVMAYCMDMYKSNIKTLEGFRGLSNAGQICGYFGISEEKAGLGPPIMAPPLVQAVPAPYHPGTQAVPAPYHPGTGAGGGRGQYVGQPMGGTPYQMAPQSGLGRAQSMGQSAGNQAMIPQAPPGQGASAFIGHPKPIAPIGKAPFQSMTETGAPAQPKYDPQKHAPPQDIPPTLEYVGEKSKSGGLTPQYESPPTIPLGGVPQGIPQGALMGAPPQAPTGSDQPPAFATKKEEKGTYKQGGKEEELYKHCKSEEEKKSYQQHLHNKFVGDSSDFLLPNKSGGFNIGFTDTPAIFPGPGGAPFGRGEQRGAVQAAFLWVDLNVNNPENTNTYKLLMPRLAPFLSKDVETSREQSFQILKESPTIQWTVMTNAYELGAYVKELSKLEQVKNILVFTSVENKNKYQKEWMITFQKIKSVCDSVEGVGDQLKKIIGK